MNRRFSAIKTPSTLFLPYYYQQGLWISPTRAPPDRNTLPA
ncbi:hypothetical protein [Pusillimonas sp. ANT_WB101]|nr:hypothetical protein [Pusillimonas sp. ANT_WB101]